MPNDNSKTEGMLKWPPEKTYKYSISEREIEIESGEYMEIPLIDNERGRDGRE